MLKKCLNYITILRSSIFLFILSCSSSTVLKEKSYPAVKDVIKSTVKCTKSSKEKTFEAGDTPCTKFMLKVNAREKLKISYKVTNAKSQDPYEHGYQVLHRYKNRKIVETMRLRAKGEAKWLETPFVRIRNQVYLADLDNDGYLEFAIHRFHPGSAIINTVKIYSLKEKITFWGEGRYQFEGDTFVKLGCMKCSKFNLKACESCY